MVVAKMDVRHRVIEPGSRVAIRVGSQEEEWTVVGADDQDGSEPAKRRLSAASPLGLALLGQSPGDMVNVRAPEETYVVAILDVC